MPRRASVGDEGVQTTPQKRKGKIFAVLALFVGICTTIGVIVWGTTDTGQIDVSATIAQSVSQGGENGARIQQAPSQVFQNMPNGGLVPQEGSQEQPPVPETQSASTTEDTASSTENGTASSTDEVSDETHQETTEETPVETTH
jgi:hypothetical protein